MTIKYEAGKALVTLLVKVHVSPVPPKPSRDGPSHLRRRVRRATERAAAGIAVDEDETNQKVSSAANEESAVVNEIPAEISGTTQTQIRLDQTKIMEDKIEKLEEEAETYRNTIAVNDMLHDMNQV